MSLSSFSWITGGLLALLSGLLMIVLIPNPSAAYVGMPGSIIGSVIVWFVDSQIYNGESEFGMYALLVGASTIVNFGFYAILAFAVGKIFRR